MLCKAVVYRETRRQLNEAREREGGEGECRATFNRLLHCSILQQTDSHLSLARQPKSTASAV